jgi:hypothetical protein
MAPRAALAFLLATLAGCGFNDHGFVTGRGDAGDDPASDGAITDARPAPDTAPPEIPARDVPGVADVPGGLPEVAPDLRPDVPVPVDMAPVGCPTGTKDCAGTCVPTAGCCADTECTGGFACVVHSCSQTTCRAGFKLCGTTCIAMAACCPAQGCCSHADCGPCQKCNAGACVNQTASEDLKNECPAAACRPGLCNGSGACTLSPDGSSGPSCTGECVRCQGGACRPRTGMCSTGQMCDDGRCPPRPPFALRINVNGPATGAFVADPGVGGVCGPTAFSTANAINGTDDDVLYQSEMYGMPLECAVGAGMLPAGPYQVVLHLAEIFWGPTCPGGGTGLGKRIFDIVLEGQKVASNVDLYAEAGCAASTDGSGRPVTKRFMITINDGTLNIAMPALSDNGKISAIEILSAW